VYNGNFNITKMLDQSNLSKQRCRLIFWIKCSVGGYLVLAKTIVTLPSIPFKNAVDVASNGEHFTLANAANENIPSAA
jgi:hypothetical protein